MKKIFLLAMVLGTVAVSTALFAQASGQDIVIQSVTGIVSYEVSAGKWEALTSDKKLTPSTMINTGLNSSLILKIGERLVTVKAMQKGTVEKLTSQAQGLSGIKMGAAVTDSTVNANTAQGRTNISTASTRASDAVEDVQWVEEKVEEKKE